MNLLNLIQSQLSPQTINQISTAVGENPDATKSALGTAIPALLGTVAAKATSSPMGANDVFNMVKQNQGSWTDSISGLLTGGQSQTQPGGGILSSLLGPKIGGVADFLASHCGIKGSSATSLLGMAAPLVMGTIAKHASSQGLGASGLAQLLGSQIPFLKDLIPSGLANTLGIGNTLKEPHETAKIETPASSYQQPAYSRPVEREPVPPSQPRRGSALKWAVPLAVAALGAWFLLSRGQRHADVGGPLDINQYQAGRETGGARRTINVTPGSIADEVAKATTTGNYGGTFNFREATFDGAGNISESARSKIQELGTVLMTTPDLKITITGYGMTDEEGLNRANAVKTALTSAGVPGERVATAGATGTTPPSVSLSKDKE